MPHFFEKWGIFLFLIHDLLNYLSSTNSRLLGLNVEEVGGRRESQSPTPNRAVRKGCYSIDS